MNKIENIGNQLLPVVAYGDAFGLPFETKKYQEMCAYIGQNALFDKLQDTTTNPYIGKYPAGTWSDDTHLSLAVARSLIATDGFNLAHIAEEHVRAYKHVIGLTEEHDLVPPIVTTKKQNGWGGSTTNSVRRLSEGVSPVISGEPDGAGNGVLMKMAPVSYWHIARNTKQKEREDEIIEFTKLTHAAPVAVASSLVHGSVLQYMYDNETPKSLLEYATARAMHYEEIVGVEPVLSTRLQNLVLKQEYLTPYDIIEQAPKGGFYAPETLIMAYGSFALHASFPNSVHNVVALGGDTDSTGSIVATLSLFANGSVQFPADYNKLFAVDRLERITKQLARVALRV